MAAEDARCDLLVISPHTDDAEIGLGGTLALLAARGRQVWCMDLTRGEMGTNDVADLRWSEADSASETLGLSGRVQLALPDGFVAASDRLQVEAVVWVLRSLCPRWVATAPDAIRHPDHVATPDLVTRALFLARLRALQPDVPEHRCWERGRELPDPVETWVTEALFQVCGEQEHANLLFDVSDHWETKQAALECYASQFLPGPDRKATYINDAAFLERVERRGRTWGHRAGVRYAEALRSVQVPVLTDLPDQTWR